MTKNKKLSKIRLISFAIMKNNIYNTNTDGNVRDYILKYLAKREAANKK